ELALGSGALALGHGREALTLAGVLALAGMVAALTGALALAGVGADAVTFVSRIGRSRHGRTRQEKGGGGGGDSSTRLRSYFHDIPPKDVGNDAPTVDRDRRTDLHPAIATLKIDFGYTANQNLFHQSQVRCEISSDLKANSITISGCPSNREGLLDVCVRASLRFER